MNSAGRALMSQEKVLRYGQRSAGADQADGGMSEEAIVSGGMSEVAMLRGGEGGGGMSEVTMLRGGEGG